MKKILLAALVLSLVFVSSAFAADLSGIATTDNEMSLYLSTNDSVAGTSIGSSIDWKSPLTFSTVGSLLSAPGTYYLHAQGLDYGYIAGFLGSFSLTGNAKFQNNTQSLLTNPNDWQVSRTGFGVGYETPTLSTGKGGNGTNDGTGPWGTLSGVPTAANWIWTDSGRPTDYPPRQPDESRYFSTKITVTPEPIGMALFGLGAGILGLTKLRRKKK